MYTRSKLYEYVVIWHPTEKQENDEQLKPKIIVDLKRVLAKDVSRVQALAARDIPDEYIEQMNQIEILIRQ